MENRRQWLLSTTLFISSLGLAACGSQSVLSCRCKTLKQQLLRHQQLQLRRWLILEVSPDLTEQLTTKVKPRKFRFGERLLFQEMA